MWKPFEQSIAPAAATAALRNPHYNAEAKHVTVTNAI